MNTSRLQEGLRPLARAAALEPANPRHHLNLGVALGRMGRAAEAAERFRDALRLKPDYAEAAENLGRALGRLRKWPEAIEAYQRAAALRPDRPQIHHRLGDALRHAGRPADAMAAHRRAIELAPDRPEPLAGLAADCGELGMVAEAIECHRRIAELRPRSALAGSDYLHLLHYDPSVSRERLLEEAKKWGAKHAQAPLLTPSRCPPGRALDDVASGDVGRGGLGVGCRDALGLPPAGSGAGCAGGKPAVVAEEEPRDLLGCPNGPGAALISTSRLPTSPHPTPNTPRPTSACPLRVGFVSPDIREHPVARLLEPILRNLDRERFTTFCYSDERRGDKLTGRIKALAQNWRDTGGMPEAKLADLIRGDRIHVLVDLAGHMGANRLPMFGRRLAPVQATHFNYPDTTGIPEMDWRISDALAEPGGVADAHDRYSVERLIRLPKRAWCYQPTEDGPAVGPLPALRNGYVTFISLNKPIKHSPPCVALWARVLKAAPGAKLMLLGFADAGQNAPIAEQYAKHGIGPDRLRFVTRRPRHGYLDLYNEADIGLDPFPYNGGVTSCDSLWMGVPLIALEGNSYLSRQGLLLMTNVGLPELAAKTEDAYVKLACAVASDTRRLSAVRSVLRQRFRKSPIADGPGFAQDLGEAYERMWRERERTVSNP
jgi:protein O-GlcNAc transferase